jgi:epoxyqueuosine reductase
MNSGNALKDRAIEIGFDLAGIAPISAWGDLEFSRLWVERGFGGELGYLSNPKRDDPRSVLPSVQSVVCVGLVYNTPWPYSIEVRSMKSEGRREKLEGPDAGRISRLEKPVLSPAKDRNLSLATGHSPLALSNGQLTTANRQRTDDKGPRGWISRYAWGRDYHEVMRAKLERLRAAIEALAPGVQTRLYVDTGPIVERAFARLSGIGWMGKNTCLINQEKGSWFFLGVILTNLALPPGLPAPDRCGSCTKCLEACPTGALVEPYVMDASRCIAYFNIELKGSIPAQFRAAIGANVFGCDICQDVCPWNSKGRSQKSEVRSQNENHVPGARAAATTSLPEFQPLEIENRGPQSPAPSPQHLAPETFSLFNPLLEALAAMSEANFGRAFAKSPIKRVKYRGWLRNLCVAMGNSGDRRFVPKLHELAAHSDPIVREHAAWALERLRGL